jgi:hypothetical protein
MQGLSSTCAQALKTVHGAQNRAFAQGRASGSCMRIEACSLGMAMKN